MLEYLEEYLDTVISLPHELQRHLSLLCSLPTPVFPSNNSNDYGDMTEDQQESLKKSLLASIRIARQRTAIAAAAHALVQEHTHAMDEDMKHFEEELRLAGVVLPVERGGMVRNGSSSSRQNMAAGVLIGGKVLRQQHSRLARSSKPGPTNGNTSAPTTTGSSNVNKRATKERRRRQRKEISDDDRPSVSAKQQQPTSSQLMMRKRNRPAPASSAIHCPCGQGSNSEMISCDYGRCPYEWFHLRCLPESALPTPSNNGSRSSDAWLCPECKEKVQRRQARSQSLAD